MNTRNFILFVLLFLFGISCVPQHAPESGGTEFTIPKTVNGTDFNSAIYIKGRVMLFLSSSLTKEQKSLVVDGATRQIELFELHHGKTRQVVVYHFDAMRIPCGKRKGRFIGCHYGANGPIHLARDEWLTSGPLYHELVHHNINGKGHEDPRWETTWRPTQNEIKHKIATRHRKEMSNH